MRNNPTFSSARLSSCGRQRRSHSWEEHAKNFLQIIFVYNHCYARGLPTVGLGLTALTYPDEPFRATTGSEGPRSDQTMNVSCKRVKGLKLDILKTRPAALPVSRIPRHSGLRSWRVLALEDAAIDELKRILPQLILRGRSTCERSHGPFRVCTNTVISSTRDRVRSIRCASYSWRPEGKPLASLGTIAH